MRRQVRAGITLLGLVLALTGVQAVRGEISGPTTEVEYTSRFESSEAPYVDVAFDRFLFGLSRIAERYQAYALHVTAGDSAILLSVTDDSVVILSGSESVDGILDVPSADPALWASLDAEQQAILDYPGDLEADETVTIYVLAPALAAATVPDSLAYTIGHLAQTFEIGPALMPMP
jgi:hypothetical protein